MARTILLSATAVAACGLLVSEASAHERTRHRLDRQHRTAPFPTVRDGEDDDRRSRRDSPRRRTGSRHRPRYGTKPVTTTPNTSPGTTPTPAPAPGPPPGPQPLLGLPPGLGPTSPTGALIAGSSPISFEMSLASGSATATSAGQLEVRLSGLVFAESGSTTVSTPSGPITIPSVSASLVCGEAIVGTSPSAPLSPSGAATISVRLTLPGTCANPAVLVHPVTNTMAYLALSRA